MKHKLYEPDGYEGCAACSVCKGAESSLPTECPGKRMTTDQQDDVSWGRADFKDGVWVSGPAVV